MVAEPLSTASKLPRVAFYSRDFDDVRETVAFVRERVLLATSAALLVALLGGYLVARAAGAARAAASRAAARHVARGRFVEPLPVDSEGRARPAHATPSTRCSSSCAGSTWRARSSSRTPRTSCARRSSRSAGSWSCCRTRSSTRRPAREFLETMGEQVERLQKLSVDLLDLSRLDAGSVELQHRARRPRGAGALGRGRVPARRSRSTAPSCDLEASRGRRSSASCDRERVAQIMRILLDNALRHTPEGTHVTVSARPRQRSRRAHGGRYGPGPPGRCAHAGVRALLHRRRRARRRPRARDRQASWPSAWTGGLAAPRPTAAPPSRSSSPSRRYGPSDGSATRGAALLAASALLLVGGCDRATTSSRRRRAGARSTTTRVQVVEGLGAKGGFDPAQIYDRLAPGVVTIISIFNERLQPARRGRRGRPGLRLRARRRGLHRHQRARGDHRRPPTARAQADQVFVEFADGNRVPAKIVGARPQRRRGAAQGRPGRPRRSRRCALGESRTISRSGEPVAAIGSPFGERQSLSVGVISALGPRHRVAHAVPDRQRDPDRRRHQPRQLRRAAARRARAGDRHQRADQVAVGGGEGVGFAIPVDAVRRSLDELREKGRVDYGYPRRRRRQELYPQLAERLDVAVDTGALVAERRARQPGRRGRPRGGRASKIDVPGPGETSPMGGDVIVAVDGKELTREHDLADVISAQAAPATRSSSRSCATASAARSSVELEPPPGRPSGALARARAGPRAVAGSARARAAACSARTPAARTASTAAGGDVTFAIDAEAEALLEAFLARARPGRGVLLRGPRPGASPPAGAEPCSWSTRSTAPGPRWRASSPAACRWPPRRCARA